MSKLEEHQCMECDKLVKVPMTLPYDGEEKPTGISIDYIDDYQNTHLLGILCVECAFSLCDKGIICLGYAGFPHSWDGYLSEPYIFKFEEKNRLKCYCSYCSESRLEVYVW